MTSRLVSTLNNVLNPSDEDNETIVNASENHNHELVRLLLADSRVDPSDQNIRPSEELCPSLEDKVVQLLLATLVWIHPIDTTRNNEALINASKEGNCEMVRLLFIDPRVDPSKVGDNAIRFAVEKSRTKTVKLLLSHPLTKGWQGCTWSYSREQHGRRYSAERQAIERRLMAHPLADPSIVDNYTIRYAAINGCIQLVRALLADPRVDPSAQDNEAIRGASKYGHDEVVRLLLAHPKVDPSARDNEAIQKAVKHDHSKQNDKADRDEAYSHDYPQSHSRLQVLELTGTIDRPFDELKLQINSAPFLTLTNLLQSMEEIFL
ncbi:ankyrin repeat domain-containing protein 50-like [Planoprotostelium fungivorum]|uniref:Ankyrin repeat domain-containing protein 50-like n=1 Tax=Planoprotostelium fungivorum TaxID=1890364 RepID=A0A2P6NBP7_9EUKA|nr:ankyrin repeat domain-containing protein 50-like [Planoprotostelium fungivorum]